MKLHYLTLSICFIVSSCIGASTPTDRYENLMEPIKKLKLSESRPYVIDGKNEPNFPDDKENNSTLAGVDSNNDGIRDDVEIYINRNSTTRNSRLALRQYAKYVQKQITQAENATKDQVFKTALDKNRSFFCVSYCLRDDKKVDTDLIESINNITYGNPSREKIELILNYKLGGKLIGSDIRLWEGYKGCDFQVDR